MSASEDLKLQAAQRSLLADVGEYATVDIIEADDKRPAGLHVTINRPTPGGRRAPQQWEGYPVSVSIDPAGFGQEPDYDTGDLRDRMELVRWLTDDAAQGLFAAGMDIYSLRALLESHPDPRAERALTRLEGNLRRVEIAMRVAAHEPQRRFELNERSRQRLGPPEDLLR